MRGGTPPLPVRVRDGDSWSASFLVPAGAARALLAPAGLRPAVVVPGRALAVVAAARHRDSDMGPYDQVALTLLVHGHAGGRPRGGIYVHRLAVSEPLAAEVATAVWGYPAVHARIEIGRRAGRMACAVTRDGPGVLALAVREGRGLPVRDPNLPNYALRDGRLLMSEWRQEGRATLRPGGATIALGAHPLAADLGALRLPRRAVASTAMPGMRAAFGAVVDLGYPRRSKSRPYC